MWLICVNYPIHKRKEEKNFSQSRKFEKLQSTNASLWYVGLAKFTRFLSDFHCFIIGSKTSKILAASVHLVWDEGRMEDVPSSKTILNNKKN